MTTLALSVHGPEIGRANIFVSAMGVSGYCFCLATSAQTARDWLGATAQALTFYGGAPQLIVPDNPRALVTVADRYEPVLTQTVQDFARHYGCSVLPAHAYYPQDKPKVELSVLLVERWILSRLRKHQFTSVVGKSTTPSPPCCTGSTSVRFKSCQAAAPACSRRSTRRP